MNLLRLNLLLIFLITPALLHGAAYIKFDGVDGESKDKDHKGWIDLSSVSVRSGDHKEWIVIESFSQVIHRDVAARNVKSKRDASTGLSTGKRDAASGMATGKRQHKPIKVSKPVDKATPMLAKAAATGQSIGNVTIQRVEGGKTETMVLQNATVAAVTTEGPREHVSFNYEKVQVRGWNPKNKKEVVGSARRAGVGAKEKANKTK